MILRGKPVVDNLMDEIRQDILALGDADIIPTLAIVRVGDRGDDIAYENGAAKRFANAGAVVRNTVLGYDCSAGDLRSVLSGLSADASVHGILMFRPLPKHLPENELRDLIVPSKDVDGASSGSVAGLFAGVRDVFPPCTPQAVMELLKYYNIDLLGKRVVVIGRSMVVGKPLSMLLLAQNATVTICHTKTKCLQEECRRADIIVAAAGAPKMLSADYVVPGQIVIDVGINVVDGNLCGDVDFEAVAPIVEAITPVPGGVGAVTSTVLLKATVNAAKKAALR